MQDAKPSHEQEEEEEDEGGQQVWWSRTGTAVAVALALLVANEVAVGGEER